MTTANPPTFDQALALARRLSARDRARLMAQIAEDLAEATPPTIAAPAGFTLPVLRGGTWAGDLPLRMTSAADRLFVDTNVLVYASWAAAPLHAHARIVAQLLRGLGCAACQPALIKPLANAQLSRGAYVGFGASIQVCSTQR